jgi:hypothetical protein
MRHFIVLLTFIKRDINSRGRVSTWLQQLAYVLIRLKRIIAAVPWIVEHNYLLAFERRSFCLPSFTLPGDYAVKSVSRASRPINANNRGFPPTRNIPGPESPFTRAMIARSEPVPWRIASQKNRALRAVFCIDDNAGIHTEILLECNFARINKQLDSFARGFGIAGDFAISAITRVTFNFSS